MTIGKRMSYEDQKLTKKVKPANQGGGPNYLGKQKEVTVPKKWLSSPDHVVAELAYITPREQKILLDADIYGSLKGKPNKGPGGIMSLQGDLGGWSSGGGGKAANEGRGGRSNEEYKNKAYYNMMTGTGKTATSKGGDTYRSKKIAKGAVPEYVNTPGGMKYVGSKYKSYGQPGFLGKLFGGKNPGYRGTYGTNTGLFDKYFGSNIGTRKNPITGELEYFSEDERVGDVKPGIGGRILGGLAGLLTGIPGVGSIIGNQIDKYKPKSMYDDMSEFNKLTLGGTHPAALDFDPDAKIQDTSFSKTVTPNTLSDKWDNFVPPTGSHYPGSYDENDYYTGTLSFEDQIAKNKAKLESLGFEEATWSNPTNNPIGGVDQYAREMEALEKARAGETLKANQLGGTLEDFYTNKQPLAPNQSLQVYDDNINFNNNEVPSDQEIFSERFVDASTGSPYTSSQDALLKKHGYDPYGVGTWKNQEGLKLINNLTNWNTRVADGGRIGYANGGLATLFTRRG